VGDVKRKRKEVRDPGLILRVLGDYVTNHAYDAITSNRVRVKPTSSPRVSLSFLS
jgi:hypothetical protein